MGRGKIRRALANTDRDEAASCPECGAPRVAGRRCWEQLGAILAWEAQDARLAAEHFLTVACFNLQHPAPFTDEAIEGLQAVFIEHLDANLPVSAIRQRMGQLASPNRRVLRQQGQSQPTLRRWPLTIADVYLPDTPRGAAERVRRWAATIRANL